MHMFVVMPLLSIVAIAYGLEQWRLGWMVPFGQLLTIGSVIIVVTAAFAVEQQRAARTKLEKKMH